MVIHVNRVHKNDDYKAIEHEGEEDDADELENAEYGSKQKRLPRKSSTFITGKKNKMKFIADEEVSLFTFKPAYSWTLKL